MSFFLVLNKYVEFGKVEQIMILSDDYVYYDSATKTSYAVIESIAYLYEFCFYVVCGSLSGYFSLGSW